MRRLLPLLLLLSGCAGDPSAGPVAPNDVAPGNADPAPDTARDALSEADSDEILTGWWDTPPEAASCTVHVTQHTGSTTLESVRQFEGGRQVAGTSHPRIDSDGQSRLTYEGDRLTRIDYQLAEPEERLPCDDEEGCFLPPTRTRGAVTLRYDADGHLEGYEDHRTIFLPRPGEWYARLRVQGTFAYTYDAEGRRTGFRVEPVRSELATGELRYAQGRLASFRMERGDTRVERTFEHDAEGRLVSRSRITCMSECSEPHTTALEYDAEGRLTATRASDRTVEYTYDAEGHLTSQNAGRPTQYLYEGGRLTEIRRDPAGRSSTHYRYEGDCDDVDLSPRPPAVYEGTELNVCVQDPAHAVESCIPVG